MHPRPAPSRGVFDTAVATLARGTWQVVVPLVTLVVLVVLLAYLAIGIVSAARAYVGGESRWARAQKSAVLALLHHAETGDEALWQRYELSLRVPLGDRRAREQLDSAAPDLAQVRAGFIAGGNHPEDVERMIWLYRWFGRTPLMAEAIAVWREGDALVERLQDVATRLRSARAAGDAAALAPLVAELRGLDESLTPLEARFSDSLGAASRRVQQLLLALLLGGSALFTVVATSYAMHAARVERRRTEALLRSGALLRSLWETTGDAVLIVDRDNLMRYANPAAHTLFGHAPGSLVGRPLATIQPQGLRDGHEYGMARYLREGVRRLDWGGIEIDALRADGSVLPVEVRFAEFELDGERHFVGFLRDITRRIEARHALDQAREQLEQRVAERTQELSAANERLREMDRLKSEFLATMSHELRTPLHAIIGFTALLRDGRDGVLNDTQQQQLGHVHDAGQHLLALINDLLDLSRIESGRMTVSVEAFDLVALAREVAAQLGPQAARKGLALRLELPEALPLRGDRRKTYQVLLNLAGNALKFTPGGTVTIRAAEVGSDVKVQVVDTGIGIAEADIGKLFEAFRQIDGSPVRAHEGTGLGLHLSRKLLELMGGAIEVSSRPGEGSTFTFTLPLALPEAA